MLEGLRVGTKNSPVEAEITAEADGFYPLTEPVTLFCNANLTINFGDPAEKARIIVKKMTEPASTEATFAFTRTFGPDFTVLADGSFDTGPLVPGSGYSIAESPSALWELASATCSDGSPVTNIDLSAGETVTCTFTNRARGTDRGAEGNRPEP